MKMLSVVAALAAVSSVALAQQAPAPFATKEITKDVYWVNGGGGNSGILVGKKGVIVIDAKTTPDGGKQLLAEVAKITPKPVIRRPGSMPRMRTGALRLAFKPFVPAPGRRRSRPEPCRPWPGRSAFRRKQTRR